MRGSSGARGGSEGDERARLFVALDVPPPARSALVHWQATALRPVAGLRLEPPESLHVTLCFLGSHPLHQIGAIAAACRGAAASAPLGLSLGGPIWLPARRPRTVGVTVADADGGLVRLQASLSEALRAGGWYEPEPRRFLAHVTVARVARGKRIRPLELPAPEPLVLDGALVTLYRSRIGPGGARYEVLGR